MQFGGAWPLSRLAWSLPGSLCQFLSCTGSRLLFNPACLALHSNCSYVSVGCHDTDSLLSRDSCVQHHLIQSDLMLHFAGRVFWGLHLTISCCQKSGPRGPNTELLFLVPSRYGLHMLALSPRRPLPARFSFKCHQTENSMIQYQHQKYPDMHALKIEVYKSLTL